MALYNNMASHFEIDVAITHSYADPGKIIHEFIHPKNSKEGPNLETRSTLTELVSIFFENDFALFVIFVSKFKVAMVFLIQAPSVSLSRGFLWFLESRE